MISHAINPSFQRNVATPFSHMNLSKRIQFCFKPIWKESRTSCWQEKMYGGHGQKVALNSMMVRMSLAGDRKVQKFTALPPLICTEKHPFWPLVGKHVLSTSQKVSSNSPSRESRSTMKLKQNSYIHQMVNTIIKTFLCY